MSAEAAPQERQRAILRHLAAAGAGAPRHWAAGIAAASDPSSRPAAWWSSTVQLMS
jgi:hypothetical protein